MHLVTHNDIDLDAITLMLDFEIGLLKMYIVHVHKYKMNFLRQGIQKLSPNMTHRQTGVMPRRIRGW